MSQRSSDVLANIYNFILIDIISNITDFPKPFKIYTKNFLIDSHVKTSGRIH